MKKLKKKVTVKIRPIKKQDILSQKPALKENRPLKSRGNTKGGKIKTKKGIATFIPLLIILGILLAGGGAYFIWQKWFQEKSTKKLTLPEVESPQPKATKKSTESNHPKEGEIVWQQDEGVRISDGSVPFAMKLDDGRIRLYFCGPGGISSAISKDGFNFQKESGVRVSDGCDPTIVKLKDGRLRMYYKVASGPGGPGQAIHKIYSAISSDGLTFQKEGLRIDPQKTDDEGWASVPDAVMLPDGRVRLYYVSADPEAEGGIMSAISTDGLNFEKEKGARIKGNFVDPALLVLNGKYYLFVAHQINLKKERPDPLKPPGIYYLVSTDGLNFSEPKLALEGMGMIDASVVQIDQNTFKMYFGYITQGQEQMVTKSATGTLK